MYTPKVCQTILCIITPISVFQSRPQKPSVWRPLVLSNLNLRPQIPLSAAANTESYAENLLTQLQILNPIINVTLQPKEMDSKHNPFTRKKDDWNKYIVTTPNGRPLVKIFAWGEESKFPPWIEVIVQRIQAYFSVYKYDDIDQSRPVYIEIPEKITLESTGYLEHRPKKTKKKPITTTASTTTARTSLGRLDDNYDEGYADYDPEINNSRKKPSSKPSSEFIAIGSEEDDYYNDDDSRSFENIS